MAFKIVKQPRAWWPVEWQGVAEDGSIVTNKIEMQFNLLKVDAAADWIAQMLAATQSEAKQLGGDAKTLPAIYAGMIARIANNWRGVEAENGDPLSYDGDKWLEALAAADAMRAEGKGEDAPEIPMPATGGDNLRLLMNEPGMFTHIFNAWRSCQAAKAEVRSGN